MSDDIRIPADHEPHARTIMAWAVHREWGADREMVERELEEVIRAIADHQTVMLLTPPDLVPAARGRKFGPEVEVIPAPVDDIWMRDIAPVFARRGPETVAIDFNFNAWDNSRPSRAGDRLARTFDFGVPVVGMPLIAEGGAFVSNGSGLSVTTRSCLLKRNPRLDEKAVERAMASIGVKRLIWLAGDRTEPITSGHIDGFVAFLPDGSLIVEDLKRGKGSRTRRSDVETLSDAAKRAGVNLERFWTDTDDHALYINWAIVGRAVITAGSRDTARNRIAEQQLTSFFPELEIRTLHIPTITVGGGGVRCLTQPVPL